MAVLPEQAGEIDFADFLAVDIRVGRVLRAEAFPKARKPAYKMWIDFGPLGERASSAQITAHYALEGLPGRLVMAVVNFPPRQIADFMSEVLVLGFHDEAGEVVLAVPDRDAPLGARLA
jgi:tRNA-binding protein